VLRGSPERRSRWGSLGRGFRQRNPLVLIAAASLAVGALLVFQSALVHGGLTLVAEGRLLRITHDDYLHVAYRVAELKKEPSQQRTIYLFGGSGTMECFIDEQSLGAEVSAASGQDVRVVSLAAHQQSMAMSLALADNLPDGPALLAIGLAPIRLTTSPEEDAGLLSGRPLLVQSPRLEALAERFYGQSPTAFGVMPGFFDYFGSYVKARDGKKGRPIPGAPLAYAEHYYPPGAKGHLPLGKRRNVLHVLENDVRLYRLYSAYNLAMVEEILKLARERGFSVALYDQPLNASAAGPDWAGVVPAYRAACRRLAREYGVAYLHIERAVDLKDDDFADLFHLLAPGRAKWQPEMARQLAAALRSPAGPAGSSSGVRPLETPPPAD
jgi:DNA-binding transcriptional MerR regulator